MTREDWLTRHPYLRSVADFQLQVDAAASVVPIPELAMGNWDDYLGEFLNGVPLLLGSRAAIDLQPAEQVFTGLIHELTSMPLHHSIAKQILDLAVQLQRKQDAPHCVLESLVHDKELLSNHPGMLRYLGWTALRGFLRPVVQFFAEWRDEDRWLRPYCPTCGSLPATAQLVGMDSGRMRLLSCGCCGTRWRYLRVGCPFCENQNDHQLPVLTVEGQNGLRIDCCDSCGGYLKVYDGRGDEPLLLEDWASLHLDIIARDRGLKRMASSLYEL
jgi:FdhE protein